jgi:hypothetical protein
VGLMVGLMVGVADLLAKTKTCKCFLFLFYRQIPFSLSLSLSLCRVFPFLYLSFSIKGIFSPLIKRTKIESSSFLKSEKKKKSFGDKSVRFFNYIITRGWPGVKRVVKEDLQAHVCCKYAR